MCYVSRYPPKKNKKEKGALLNETVGTTDINETATRHEDPSVE